MNSLSAKEGFTFFFNLDFYSVPWQLVMVIGLNGVQFGLIIQVINKIERYAFQKS